MYPKVTNNQRDNFPVLCYQPLYSPFAISGNDTETENHQHGLQRRSLLAPGYLFAFSCRSPCCRAEKVLTLKVLVISFRPSSAQPFGVWRLQVSSPNLLDLGCPGLAASIGCCRELEPQGAAHLLCLVIVIRTEEWRRCHRRRPEPPLLRRLLLWPCLAMLGAECRPRKACELQRCCFGVFGRCSPGAG